jgi:glycosyltransferase involved in cell wall biosynthesis
MSVVTSPPNASLARPKVTFALFAYNQEGFVREAAAAALAQDYSPLEVILSDDCSSDRTYEIMEELATSYEGPHEVRLNRNPVNVGRAGFGAHVNLVMAKATGDLVLLAAGDDISVPRRTRTLVDRWTAAGRPPGSIFSAVRILSDDPSRTGRISRGNRTRELPLLRYVRETRGAVIGASHAITRDLFLEFGPLPDGTQFEDMTLAFRSALAGRILYVDEPLVDWRQHGESLSGSSRYDNPAKWSRWMDALVSAYESYLRDYVHFAADEHRDPRIVSEIHRSIARAHRSRRLASPALLDRLVGALSYTAEYAFADRVAFVLQALGLREHAVYRASSAALRAVRRLRRPG